MIYETAFGCMEDSTVEEVERLRGLKEFTVGSELNTLTTLERQLVHALRPCIALQRTSFPCSLCW